MAEVVLGMSGMLGLDAYEYEQDGLRPAVVSGRHQGDCGDVWTVNLLSWYGYDYRPLACSTR